MTTNVANYGKLGQLIRRSSSSNWGRISILAVLLIGQQIQCLQQTATNLPSQQQQQQQELNAKSYHQQNGFQLFAAPHDLSYNNVEEQQSSNALSASASSADVLSTATGGPNNQTGTQESLSCPNGLLTFELSTGFIFKPTSAHETLSMMPSTLQLTDCLDYCLNNQSCLAINFEMGLCVLLATSAKQNAHNLYSSQFPVFTIYAEKKCLLASDVPQAKQRQKRCQRAWTFERVAGYEMKTKPRRRLKVNSKESCMDACLIERDFECRSANWYRLTGECTLSDQDRHSVSQSEAGDQQIKSSLGNFYGPSNSSMMVAAAAAAAAAPFSFNMYANSNNNNNNLQYKLMSAATGPSLLDKSRLNNQLVSSSSSHDQSSSFSKPEGGSQFNHLLRPFENSRRRQRQLLISQLSAGHQMAGAPSGEHDHWQHYIDMPANAVVDYLENNCVYEPNRLCEFRKIQNRILKTVDSIYQDVANLDECKQKCLNAPYRCYSFDYGDTSEKVCRTSHLDQASLLSVKEPYLEVVGAITYELAACFNVSIQCRAKEMVALVSSSKSFRGKIYAKTRPSTCVNDVKEALQFELSMRYHDDSCDVRASSNQQKGVFSSDIVIQHHDRIMTTQDVGLSVYCQYDLGNRSVTNNVDLAIDRIPDGPVESKQQQQTSLGGVSSSSSSSSSATGQQSSSPLTITGLATTVVRSPNVTMRITNMNGHPVSSATVGDRLALLFEVQEKSSPFGIFVREIVAMDGKQLLATIQQQQQQQVIANNSTGKNDNQLKLGTNGRNYFNSLPGGYHYASGQQQQQQQQAELLNETRMESLIGQAATPANSIQFIDSDGCPTDANLMGPLVKMDPTGHRLLAPFDAFKFPTSDMVFFRAVVTSCLAECKPAVCSPAGSSGPLAAPDMAPDTAAYQSPPTSASTDSSYLLTSRMTPPPTTTAASPTTTTSVPTTTTTTIVTTMGANLSELTRQTLGSGPKNQAPMETLIEGETFARSTVGESTATTATGQKTQDTTSGMTVVVPGFSQSADATPTTALPTTVGSTWPTPTSMAAATTASQLLADILQQVNMTNNHNGRAPPRPTTTTTASYLAGSSFNNNVDPVGQMTSLLELASMTAEQKQQILESFEAKLRQKFAVKPSQAPLIINGTSAPDLADLTDMYTGLLSSLISSSSAGGRNKDSSLQTKDEDPNNRTNRTIGEQLSDAFVSLLNSKLSQTQQVETAKVDYDKTSANKLETTGDNQTKSSEVTKPSNRTMITSTQQQEIKPQLGNRTQKKRDKTTANLQALADSYLGAFQSFGKRRKREAERDNLHVATTSNYVYMEQPQSGSTQISGQPEGSRFTQAVVEMYHTRPGDNNLKLARFRRQAMTFDQPTASVGQKEELVVQSIKIVDRLQFKDEKQRTTNEAYPVAGQRAARSDLVMMANSPGLIKKPSGWSSNQVAPKLSSSSGRSRQVVDGDNFEDGSDDQMILRSSSSLSAFTVFLVALCFVFVQISMVLLCLLDWGRRRRPPPRSSSLSSASSINVDCSNPFDGSTILSSYHSDNSSVITPTTISSSDNYIQPHLPTPGRSIGHDMYNQYYPTVANKGRREERHLGTLSRHNLGSQYLTYAG